MSETLINPPANKNEGSIPFTRSPSQNGASVNNSVNRHYAFDREKHIHTLDGQPLIGTSTAVQVLAKPLTWWAAGMALAPLGWLNKRKSTAADRLNAAAQSLETIRKHTPKEWADKLESCYRAHHEKKESAAVTGTDMHAELETYVNNCIYIGKGEPMAPAPDCCEAETIFAEWALNNVREFLWAEAHCYSERMRTGGICDCGAVLKSGGLAIIDFKSSKEAYYSQFVQAGGYAAQIKENGLFRADGVTVSTGIRRVDATALIIFPFGGNSGPKVLRNVAGYQAAFEAAVTLHKLQGLFDEGADFSPVKEQDV